MVDADQKAFQAAPRLSQIQSGVQNGLPQSYRHFQQALPQPPIESRLLVSAAALTGKPVFGSANEMLGQVQDMAVDLPVGRVVYVTIQPVAGPGTEGKLYVVPPAAVKVDGSGKLLLPASRERFVAGPYFQKAFSTDILDRELVKSLYAYYLPRAAAPKSDGGQSAVQAAAAPGMPAPATVSAPAGSDSETTKAVMMEILNEGKVALRGDVQITTRRGRVKLAGTARNEREKQFVLEAARRVVGVAFVDDTLLVKGKNTTTAAN
jgi:sporulation protein YlmC with PRC-barrel domain